MFEQISRLTHLRPCYCNRIITYTEMGCTTSEQMFHLAQQISPDCALCYYNIGNSLYSRGNIRRPYTAGRRPHNSSRRIRKSITASRRRSGRGELERPGTLPQRAASQSRRYRLIIDFGLFLSKPATPSGQREVQQVLELRPDTAWRVLPGGDCASGQQLHKALELYKAATERREHAGPHTVWLSMR